MNIKVSELREVAQEAFQKYTGGQNNGKTKVTFPY
jgi:hypothetical protein